MNSVKFSTMHNSKIGTISHPFPACSLGFSLKTGLFSLDRFHFQEEKKRGEAAAPGGLFHIAEAPEKAAFFSIIILCKAVNYSS